MCPECPELKWICGTKKMEIEWRARPFQAGKSYSHIYPFMVAMVTGNPAACVLALHISYEEN